MDSINLTAFAGTFGAYKRCIADGKKEWEIKHGEYLDEWLKVLPHGGGLDTGVKFDYEKSTEICLVFHTAFHHMDENGGYDGWTEHTLKVTPSFGHYDMRLSGPNRNGIKEYLYDLFGQCFHIGKHNEYPVVS